MAKIRVLYVHQDGLVTGSAISLKYFLQAMDREKFEPIVLLAEEGPARQLYEELNIEVHIFKFTTFWTSPGPNWYSPRNLKQYRALIPNSKLRDKVKELKPDIIHINDKAALNAGISTKKLNIPIVQHSRSTYKDANTQTNTLISSYLIKKNSCAVIAISEDESDLLENSRKLYIINNTISSISVHNAFDCKSKVKKELTCSSDSIIISFIGALSPNKGIFSFIKLSEILVSKKEYSLLKFIVVGKASKTGTTVLENNEVVKMPISEYIKKILAQKNLFNWIKVLGFRNDALSIMAASDIIIVPNKISVMGRQPIEAQALGVPVVVTQGHSGKSKVVKNGEGGIVISSPVNMDELVGVVEKLIKNPELRKEMGEKGKAYAKEKFDPLKNMRKIEEIYMELLNEKKGNDSKS